MGLANKIIFEICTVIQDKRADCIGGLSVAFELFESTLIPMLLQGSDCWFRIKNKTMKMLEKIQLKFARVALTCSQGCPVPKLYSETGLILMPLRIIRNKVMFMFHVASLSPGTLARDLYDIERQEC